MYITHTLPYHNHIVTVLLKQTLSALSVNDVSISLLRNYIPVIVNGIDVFALVVTGADVCVASETIFDGIVKDNYLELKLDRQTVMTADKSMIPVLKRVRIRICIGNIVVPTDFYIVKDFQTNFILGLNWLQNHKIKLDFNTNRLTIDPRRIILADEDMTIPARSETVVIARIKGDSLPMGVIGTTDYCAQSANLGLLVGKTLSSVKENKVFHMLTNVSDVDIIVHKGTRIGKFVALSGHDALVNIIDSSVPVNKDNVKNENKEQFMPSRDVNMDVNSLTSAQKESLSQIIDEHADVFVGPDDKLGFCDIIEHEIHVEEGTKPFCQRAYRMAPKQQQAMQREINKMLEQGVIEHSTSPWGSPCFLVAKKSGEFRFVADLRKLNSCIKVDAHPLPTVEESLDFIGQASPKYFTTLDLQSGFYQTALHKDSRPYTAFRTSTGLYQFTRLVMGLKNSPATFQRLMECIFRGMTWQNILIYIDDIVIFSPNFDTHIKDIRQVFERLRASGLKLKAKKCFFGFEKIHYLGHIISKDGIAADTSKIEAVQNYPIPENVKALRSFLGLSGYYRKHIFNYSKIARPLHKLTKREAKFQWTHEEQDSFDALKHALTHAPILAYPRWDTEYLLYTDASSESIGCCLAQIQDGKERVISYYGRSLSQSERNYGITQRECLALVYSVKRLEHYLRTNHFKAIVDHSALQRLLTLKEPSGMYARWIAYLQGFDYEIKVRPGVMHGNADAISRRSYSIEKDKTSIVIPNNQAICELHEVSEIISLDKVKMNQELDPCYSDIIKYLRNNLALPDSEIKRQHVISVHSSYLLIDDVLYHIEVKQGKGHKKDRSTIQLAIPICMKELILKHVHDDILSGGHMGINRTIEKARAQYFWPNMYSDIVNYVKSCERCSSRKQPVFPVRASFEPMPIPEGPWQRVSTDIFGPLPSCKETGNKYVLLFIEYLTKYAEMIALPDIKAEQVARCLVDRIVCVHGPPSYLHSDRGTNYLSAIVAKF